MIVNISVHPSLSTSTLGITNSKQIIAPGYIIIRLYRPQRRLSDLSKLSHVEHTYDMNDV